MKTADRAAILAALPIDQRSGYLVVDENDQPIKPGTTARDGDYLGTVTLVDEDEGRIVVDVDWDAYEVERYTAQPHDARSEYPDISTWLINDFEVLR